ncbi:hypothetical protein [Corynebacterium epidermidicanis]|uniref:Uncharacterized protein n=1 Tax=Corynebacterium epidermidicanis TaxID=1050174 RepID=A0A0G3GPC0_9CORY|nr:hypothetical protein [Corynebacterium epidermidicanis]AKK03071.1 hypothetical protein CEPID_06050 [Corynebacterium epidermidicanis]
MKVESAQQAYNVVMADTTIPHHESMLTKKVNWNGEYFMVCADTFYDGAPSLSFAVKPSTGEIEVWHHGHPRKNEFYKNDYTEQ